MRLKSTLQSQISAARSPETITAALQILKSVLAATLAWWFSTAILSSALPFLAPWVALLTVHVTVHRSLTLGLQTTVASVLGVGLSFAIGSLLGVHLWTFALALLIGLVASRIPWIRDEGVAVATTAVFVLGSGFGEQAPLLVDRILEVVLGVGIGVVVNLVVVPPLRDRQAARYVDAINRRMGRVLTDMSEDLAGSWDTDRVEAWFAETDVMREQLEGARQTVRIARESERANPRSRFRALADTSAPGGPAGPDQEGDAERPSYENILGRVDEGISHLRHLLRTLHEAGEGSSRWDDGFKKRLLPILRDAGRSIADPDGEVEPIADRLDALGDDLSAHGILGGSSWPLYGSLLVSLRHIAVIVDDVASARHAREAGPTEGSSSPP